jgi:hypothetical protein
MKKRKDISQAVKIFANFSLFANIEAQLEGGCLYRGADSQEVANKIIRLCKAEQRRLLAEYDAILDKVL